MAFLVGIERGFISREEGVNRILMILQFLDGTNVFHGAWPHWMDGTTGNVLPFSEYDDGGDLATGSMGFGLRDIVWHDGTAEEGITTADGDASAESRFGMPDLVKNIGPLPITFRTLRGTGSP